MVVVLCKHAPYSLINIVTTQLSPSTEVVDYSVQLASFKQIYVQLLAHILPSSVLEEILVNQETTSKPQGIKHNLDQKKSLTFVVLKGGTL